MHYAIAGIVIIISMAPVTTMPMVLALTGLTSTEVNGKKSWDCNFEMALKVSLWCKSVGACVASISGIIEY